MYRVDVRLWSLDVAPEVLTSLRDHLAEDELRRAGRFVHQIHRDRYIAGRGMLRRILAAETGGAPRGIRFSYGVNGKPSLDGGPGFNLSHSGAKAALGISRDGPLGIDIEQPRPIEAAVARRHFSAAEYAELSRLSEGKWLDGFYRCWTRKEAIIKASGLGLSMPLDSFDVSLSPDAPARLLRIEGDRPDEWRLAHFAPAPGWVGAVAARTGGAKIELMLREAGA